MILIRGLKFDKKPGEIELLAAACAKLRVSPGSLSGMKIIKRSLDARKKPDVKWVYSLAFAYAGNEEKLIKKCADAAIYEKPVYEIPHIETQDRPLVVGFGPAGMFASLVLAKAGMKPLVIERGKDALSRKADIERLRNGGVLDTESNVQFGEGGAGTFSDGKLGTGTHDRRISWVLEQFYLNGAKESVMYDSKPHVGTDVLIDVVRNIRRSLVELGGEIRFSTRLTGLDTENGRIKGVYAQSGGVTEYIPCTRVILAVGHSARDTFEMLEEMKIAMQPKPFSMGVRIEHLQKDIDFSQYGRERGELPAADYSLNVHLPDGTSAYTFCMCPGGEVFAAASEEGGVCTNGMSYSARDGVNSNSALLVTLHPEDFPYEGNLGGMKWQRDIERAAYNCGGSYLAPAQLAGDFLAHRASAGAGCIEPSYKPGVVWTDLHTVLPERITSVLENALPELGRKLKGFDCPDAVLTAPEARSSSPVRIIRDENCEGSLKGLYPCGEGAGYAGGITSAAVDGMRCAEKLMESCK